MLLILFNGVSLSSSFHFIQITENPKSQICFQVFEVIFILFYFIAQYNIRSMSNWHSAKDNLLSVRSRFLPLWNLHLRSLLLSSSKLQEPWCQSVGRLTTLVQIEITQPPYGLTWNCIQRFMVPMRWTAPTLMITWPYRWGWLLIRIYWYQSHNQVCFSIWFFMDFLIDFWLVWWKSAFRHLRLIK